MPLPFTYGEVHLYDELKHLALQHQLQNAKQANPVDLKLCLSLNAQIEKVLKDADDRRNALYTKDSIDAFLGVQSHLRKSGFFGKILAFLINPSNYLKYY